MFKNNFLKLSNGMEIPIVIENRRGIRNVTLRPKIRPQLEVHVSKPYIIPVYFVSHFIQSKRNWLERFFYTVCVDKKSIKPDSTITFLDKKVSLVYDGSKHGNRYINTSCTVLCIGGDLSMFEHRVKDCIKKEFLIYAKNIIKTVSKEYWPNKISLRDTTSRWGSCSSTGTISLCWRLALTPNYVSRYVIMHELSHRKHMDHSKEFWMTVSELYGDGVEKAKRWLTENGTKIQSML